MIFLVMARIHALCQSFSHRYYGKKVPVKIVDQRVVIVRLIESARSRRRSHR